MKLQKFMAICVMSLAFAGSAWAQNTTASMQGQAQDPSGSPLEGVSVEVIHVPSGTVKQTTTQAGGQWQVRNLRVGGPYTVTATKSGYQGTLAEDIQLGLSENLWVDLELESAADVGDLQVVGSVMGGTFSPDNMGTATTITRDQLDNLPSIGRSLNDFARLDPRITVVDKERGELSVAGQNNRYNNTSIDGVPTNDEFGLNANGQPSLNNSFSLETIEDITVEVSPYDVTQQNFVGGGINAVTRSGTNDFEGGFFYNFRNDDMIGEDENGNDFQDFDETTWGAHLSGPIVKDTLFFFLSYENFENSAPLRPVGLAGSNAANIFDLTQAELDEIISIAQGYGFDPGNDNAPSNIDNSDEKITAKIDWNISNNHRFSGRYSLVEAESLVVPNRSSFDYSLSSHWYQNSTETETFVGHLYSDWSSNFSTEVSLSSQSYESIPILGARKQPQVEVETDAGSVWFGTELFRHANELYSDTKTAYAAGEWFLGDHTVKFGLDWKENDFDNVFVFSSLGQYVFESVDDFRTGNYDFYQLRIGTDPNDPFPAADWSYSTTGLFVQDTWDVNYNLTLQYGFRVDTPNVDEDPDYNPDFEAAYGFANNGTIDGNEVFQPRVGFNWDLSGERSRQLRGGLGLFQGSAAGVWLSNPFTNPGTNVAVHRSFDGSLPVVGDPTLAPTVGGASIVQDVDVVAPDFEQPTVWKASLAWDEELPWWDLIASVELLHSETKNGIHYEHLNLGAPTGTLPDGRNSYYADPTDPGSSDRANANPNFNDVLLLRNTGKGSTTNFTVSLEKSWDTFYGRLSYSAGRSEDVNSGTSSRAISNWNNRAVFNPNEDVESTSNFEIRDRLSLLLTKSFEIFPGLQTNVSAFYEGRSGRPFSWAFDNDANGDGIRDNDLLYVPAGPGDVAWTDPAMEAAFLAFVETNSTLRQYQGQVVPRNSDHSSMTHSIDLRFSQEIPSFGETRSYFYFDILNFANLLNDEWGHIDQVPFEYVAEIINFEGIDDQGRYIYEWDGWDGVTGQTDASFLQDRVGQSRWSVQLGFRFEF